MINRPIKATGIIANGLLQAALAEIEQIRADFESWKSMVQAIPGE